MIETGDEISIWRDLPVELFSSIFKYLPLSRVCRRNIYEFMSENDKKNVAKNITREIVRRNIKNSYLIELYIKYYNEDRKFSKTEKSHIMLMYIHRLMYTEIINYSEFIQIMSIDNLFMTANDLRVIKEFIVYFDLWVDICKETDFMTEKNIRKYKDSIPWPIICKYAKMTEEFMIEHEKYLFWFVIVNYQELSEKFLIRYKDKEEVQKLVFSQYSQDHTKLSYEIKEEFKLFQDGRRLFI